MEEDRRRGGGGQKRRFSRLLAMVSVVSILSRKRPFAHLSGQRTVFSQFVTVLNVFAFADSAVCPQHTPDAPFKKCAFQVDDLFA